MFSFRSRISAAAQLIVLLLGLANSGCSFIFVTPPPPRIEQDAHPNADCSTSRAAPIVDGIVTGYQVLRTIYATQAPDSVYQGAPIGRGADIGLGLTFTALFLASTIYGGVATSDCRDFKARNDEEDLQEPREELPPPRRKRAIPAEAPPAEPEPANEAPAAPEAPPASPPAVPEPSPQPAVIPAPSATPSGAAFPPAP